MVVLLNPLCILLFGTLHAYKSEVMCCSFRDVMTSKRDSLIEKAGASIRRLKIVELFGHVFLKLEETRRKEAFHIITDFTLLRVLSRKSKKTDVILSQCLQ